jgi:hypothetical protein
MGGGHMCCRRCILFGCIQTDRYVSRVVIWEELLVAVIKTYGSGENKVLPLSVSEMKRKIPSVGFFHRACAAPPTWANNATPGTTHKSGVETP